MIKKKKKHFNFSIQMIVFGILIITILPMNLLYIHAARQSVKALNVQAETSVQNLLALIGTDISERITQTNRYMGEVVSNNAYYTALPQQESWDEYQLNKFFLGQNLIDNTTVSTSCFITCAWYPAFESTQNSACGNPGNRKRKYVLPDRKPSRCPRVPADLRNL